MNWQRVAARENPPRVTPRRRSTAPRCAKTIPPPKPRNETLRNSYNKLPREARANAREPGRRGLIVTSAPSADARFQEKITGIRYLVGRKPNCGRVEGHGFFPPAVRDGGQYRPAN